MIGSKIVSYSSLVVVTACALSPAPAAFGVGARRSADNSTPITESILSAPPVPIDGDPSAESLASLRLLAMSRGAILDRHRNWSNKLRNEDDSALREYWRAQQPRCKEYREKQSVDERRRNSSFGTAPHGCPPALRRDEGPSWYAASSSTFRYQLLDGIEPRCEVASSDLLISGVETHDLVKRDRNYAYILSSNTLSIAALDPPRVVGSIAVSPGADGLLLEEDRLVVFSVPKMVKGPAGIEPHFNLQVFDVRDRRSPKPVRQIAISGTLLGVRKIGRTIHLVISHRWRVPEKRRVPAVPLCDVRGSDVDRVLAANFSYVFGEVSKPQPDFRMLTWSDRSRLRVATSSVLSVPFDSGSRLTSIFSFSLRGDELNPRVQTIRTTTSHVYLGERSAYLFAPSYRGDLPENLSHFFSDQPEVTLVHKFRLTDDLSAKYVGSGMLPGRVVDPKAVHERHGYLWSVTSGAATAGTPQENTFSVLHEARNGQLIRVHAIGGLLGGAIARSLLVAGHRGYIEGGQTGVPWVSLDLRTTKAPKHYGDMHSRTNGNRLFSVDPFRVLSVSQVEVGAMGGILLQYWDATEPEPNYLYEETLGSEGSSSAVQSDPRAFTFESKRGLLALPVTACARDGETYGNVVTFTGLRLYRVNDKGLERLGVIEHSPADAHCIDAKFREPTVSRSFFTDNRVWSIGPRQIKVRSLSDLETDQALLESN